MYIFPFQHDKLFQFVSGMKLKRNRDLFVLTSRLQEYIATSLTDTTQVNYRILSARVSDLTKNTACDVTRFDASGYLQPAASSSSSGYGQQNVNTAYRPRPPGSGYFAKPLGSKSTGGYGGTRDRISLPNSGVSAQQSTGDKYGKGVVFPE